MKKDIEEEAIKYLIKFDLDVNGVVEENDVIGAVFGQTEGLMGPQYDLREMQRIGKIGRIQVKSITNKGNTNGVISISCGLDMPSTTLLAALVESVNQIGPYKAHITLKNIIDQRKARMDKIMDRAKHLLNDWKTKSIPEADDAIQSLRKQIGTPHATEVGIERMAAGPDIESSKEIILVEGRADVNNLLKYGIKNTLSIGGGKFSSQLKNITKGKIVTAFLDRDRGGDMNLQKLMQIVNVDFIAEGPKGEEVENLKPDEIFEALNKKNPVNKQIKVDKTETKTEVKNTEVTKYKKYIDEVDGTLEAILLDKKNKSVDKIPVSSLVEKMSSISDKKIVVIIFDGVITQRLIDISETKGVKVIVGNRQGNIKNKTKIETLVFGK